MKNSKKKLFTVALAICLIAILSFTTLAWFTDSEEITNTFTVGSIVIDQHEQQYNDQGQLEDFQNNKVLMPIVNTTTPSADPNYQDKIVTVENKGNNPAYIRTSIAVPTTLKGYLELDINDAGRWTAEYVTENVMIGGVSHTVYTYRFEDILGVGETSHQLLKGVYLNADVDVKLNTATGNLEFCKWNATENRYDFSGFAVQDSQGTTYQVNVLVATQAVQSQGFGDVTDALTSAFGAATPWG